MMKIETIAACSEDICCQLALCHICWRGWRVASTTPQGQGYVILRSLCFCFARSHITFIHQFFLIYLIAYRPRGSLVKFFVYYFILEFHLWLDHVEKLLGNRLSQRNKTHKHPISYMHHHTYAQTTLPSELNNRSTQSQYKKYIMSLATSLSSLRDGFNELSFQKTTKGCTI